MDAASLAAFAAANDAAAATSAKLEKQELLGGYFRGVPPDVLADAVRFASGKAFAAVDERVTGVSSAAFRDVIVAMVGEPADVWHARSVRCGETGEALADLWSQRGPPDAAAAAPLTLRDLRETFDAFAAVKGPSGKRDLLADLLARCRTPREAAYVGKILQGDLRSGARQGVLRAAVAVAFGVTLGEVNRAALLIGDLGDVALLARQGRLQDVQFRLFHPLGFMLATPRETAAEAADLIQKSGRPWRAEHKLDGVRAQVHKQGVGDLARVAIYSRTMDRADAAFPDVVAQARTVGGDWILDGEVVPWDVGRDTVGAFADIQKRLGRIDPKPELLRSFPCRFVAFDVLYRDGRLLIDEPQRQRRAILEDLVHPGAQVARLDVVEVRVAADIEAAFAAARDARNEGLILKDPVAPYAGGRRGQGWIKLKTHLPTLDVVVVAAEYGHGKRRNSLSDYTFAVWSDDPADGGRLLTVGKAFSGVTDAEIVQLTERFLASQTGRHGRVFAVRPEVVLEVAFDAIQESRRHASGFGLRFPRIKRIRWDRAADSADTLARVREVFSGTGNFNRATPRATVRQQLELF